MNHLRSHESGFDFFHRNISADHMLYTEADLEASMDKIEVLNFHEEKEVKGIRFWAYHAGHVLGAAMFMIEIAGGTSCLLQI